MATAKPLKPSTYDGQKRDPQTVDTWLARMTTYLRLTNTADADKVEIASTYLEDIAYTWYTNEQATLTTFDLFKSALRNHFVPQNYRDVAYRRYKALKQGDLSVSDYSIQLKTLADQVGSDRVPAATRDFDFIEGLHWRIKQFIVAQPPVKDEKWEELVGRALRQEETLSADYNRPPKAMPPSGDAAQRTASRNQNSRSGTSRSGNWKSKPNLTSTGSKPSNSPNVGASPQKALDPLTDTDREFLRKHDGCFRCRRTYAGHFWKDCSGVGANSEGSKNSREDTVKGEVNFVSEADEPYQYEEPSDYYNVPEPSDQNVPPIVLPIQLDDTVSAEGLIDPGSSSDFVSKKLILKNPTRLKPYPTQSPSLLRHALESRKSVRISKQLTTHLEFSPPTGLGVKTEPSTTLKVAPLASHDVILGMPFLVRNNLLVDPVSRSVIPREDIVIVNSDETNTLASPILMNLLRPPSNPELKDPDYPSSLIRSIWSRLGTP
jgi:hypothetical protein